MAKSTITLAKLMLVRSPRHSLATERASYLVRAPVKPGVQPMLRMERAGTRMKLLDSLVLLPQIVPFPTMRTVKDQILSAAFDIMEKAYKDAVRDYRLKTRKLVIPANVLSPEFHPAREPRVVAAIDELLRTCEYRDGDPQLPDALMEYHLRRNEWTPLNLEEGRVAHSANKGRAWRVLSSWEHWESSNAPWLNRLEDVEDKFSEMGEQELVKAIDKLRKLCGRTLGLYRKGNEEKA